MSAYFETGFSVRQPMWHRQGTVLEDYPTDWNDARAKAGLLWEPTYADLFVQQVVPALCRHCAEAEGQPHAESCPLNMGPGKDRVGRQALGPEGCVPVRRLASDTYLVHVPAAGHQAIVRDDTWATLATPTDQYRLIQHSQMGELLEAYTESWRKAGAAVKFETAGSLKGGRVVWAMVWLDEPYHVAGDDSPTYPFASILNPHDGSGCCRLIRNQVRIVCWNTYSEAEWAAERSGEQVILRHSGNVAEKMEDAKAGLATLRDDAKAWRMVAEDLASVNVSDAMFATFLDEFIPVPENASERTRNQREERRQLFTRLYHGDLAGGLTMQGITGNGYGLVQAAGEYLDHLRPYRNQDTYLARTMFSPEPVKRGVIRLVRELATL